MFSTVNAVQEVIGGTNTANSLSGGIDEVFQRTDSAGARSFLADPLGSTLALTDSTGTLQTSYTFEPFGNTTLSGSATTNSFAYTGRELDASNLYYYRARYYNPQLQRFISEDPIGLFGSGPNFYAYVNNNPNLFTDPTGFCVRPPTPEEYNACMIRAVTTRDNAIWNARGEQLAGGLLTLAGTAVAWDSLPTLGETFFNDGLAGLFDFAHAGGFAYFGAAGPLAAGIGIFGKGTYDVANAWDQYYANSIHCAAAVSSNP